MAMETIRRQACRAIILNPENEVLLIKVANPNDKWTGWITPGGGIEAGETKECVLRRELFEELGLQNFDMGPLIWKRSHSFQWGDSILDQEDFFFYLQSPRFEPEPQQLMEGENFLEFRWWSLEELAVTKDSFAPRRMFEFLSDLVEGNIPPIPIDVGI